jgi:hypothetical protein
MLMRTESTCPKRRAGHGRSREAELDIANLDLAELVCARGDSA